MVSVLVPSIVFAESETVTYGTALVQDDQATNDSIVITLCLRDRMLQHASQQVVRH